MNPAQIRIEVLRQGMLEGFRSLFEASHCGCFCRYWHFDGTRNEWLERTALRPEESLAEQASDVAATDPRGRGLLALRGDMAVGWMKLAPRSALVKLRNQGAYRPLDLGPDDGAFSIGCFLIHPEHRRTGVAAALLAAAPAHARAWGARTLEAYPLRSEAALHDEQAFMGPEALYRRAGFEPVHDTGPYPVYRLALLGG